MIEVTGTGSVSGDTAAVQDALDQSGHVLLEGHLQALTPLRWRENARITLAPGAVLERVGAPGLLRNRWDGDDYYGYSGRGNLLIDGNGTLEMAGHLPGDTALPASALTIAHADRVTIRDVTIRNAPGAHGIDLIGCRNVRIEGVRFDGFTDTGGRHFSEAIQIDGTYGTYSGDCEPADKTPCDDVLITGCRFGASADLPAWPRAVGSHGYADDVTGHEHRGIRVVDCAMDGLTDSAVWAWKWSESIVSGNTIRGAGGCGIVAKDGTWDTDITGNHVYESGASGIWVNDGCHNVTVSGNRVIGSSRGAHRGHYGIRVSGGCMTMVIRDNRVRLLPSGSNARYGLSIADGVRIWHHGNDLRWSGTDGPLQDDSTSPTTTAEDAL